MNAQRDRAGARNITRVVPTIAASAGASALVALLGYRLGALSRSGAAGATAAGAIVLAFGGASAGSLLVSFFLSSSALSRWRRDQKRAKTSAAKGERRDLGQVVANGGVAALAAIGVACWPNSAWMGAYLGAVATVNADTWSTEIGTLSPSPPRAIVTLAPVPPGTSGAVSPLGLAASMAGAAWIGVTARLLGQWCSRRRPGGGWEPVRAAAVSGTAGALLDSLLGATVQGRYLCIRCGVATENKVHSCGSETRHTGGLRWIDNDAVNFVSSAGGALVGALLASTRLAAGSRPLRQRQQGPEVIAFDRAAPELGDRNIGMPDLA